jgi:autotransporter-associated beta strand protein
LAQFLLFNGTYDAGAIVVGDAGRGRFFQNAGNVTTGSLFLGLKGGGEGAYALAGGTLSAVSIYTVAGSGTFMFSGGTLRPRSSGAILFPSGNLNLIVQSGGANIDSNGLNPTINKPLLHDSVLGSLIDGGLTKSGAGTLTLNADNTYNGDTQITGGTLIINAAHTSAVYAQTGTTLGGVGTLSGGARLYAGAQLAPGGAADSIGTLRLGPSQLDVGSALVIDIANATSFDKLTATSFFQLFGDLDVNLLNGYVPPVGTTFQIATMTLGLFEGAFGNASSGFVTDDGYAYRVDYDNGITLTRVVPEPTTLTSAVLLAGALLRRRSGVFRTS